MKNKKDENYVIIIDSNDQVRPYSEFKCPKCDHQLFHIDYEENWFTIIRYISLITILLLMGYSLGRGYFG